MKTRGGSNSRCSDQRCPYKISKVGKHSVWHRETNGDKRNKTGPGFMTPLTGLPCIVRLQNRMESYSPFSTSMLSICRPGGTQKWVSILLDTGEEDQSTTNERQKTLGSWLHLQVPSIIRLDERNIYSPFSPWLGQSVSSGSGSRKDVVSVLYRNGERDGAKAVQNPDILGRESILPFSCRPRHRRNEHSPES